MGGFTMKPSRAYGGLLLVLVITQAVECRSIVGNQHHQDAAGDHKHVREGKFREGVKVEIIHKPKELKVFVNKSPASREESVKNDSKKDWHQIQSEMIKNGIKTSSNQGWESSLPSEEETDNVDDSYETGESGDGSRRDVVNIHHVLHGQSFVSRDHNHHQRSRIRHAQHTKRPNSSSGGLGILWSLVIFAFVLSVIAVVFLGRWCCYGNVPDAELESVKVEHTNYSPKKSAIKEARIREGKRKSLENRKVLRRLSADQGASTVKEELAIACSVISPSIDTRRKNSEALHTRACVRAATSHSRRNSSFQEDLLKARCEFENAPARFAKLVSLAGDEKDTDARQESGEPIKSAAGDTAVIMNCN